jgi:5-methylcytosine-specific restriction endonuclease McrA
MTATGQQGSGAGEQLALLCECGRKPVEVKRLGCCRSCYERRRHSLRFFDGLRERVLKRDRLCCRGCGVSAALVVHHRAPQNQAETLITLCVRCHMRVHHSTGSRYWFPRILLRLWGELHQRGEPLQLQLTLGRAMKRRCDS